MKKNKPSELSEHLTTLIANQLLVISEASKQEQHAELSSLMAYELFDTLDWARRNLKKQLLRSISAKVRLQVPEILSQPCDLEQIEDFAESKMRC